MTCGIAYCMKHETVHADALKCPKCAQAEQECCIKCQDPHKRCFCCSSPACHDPDCIGFCLEYAEEVDNTEWEPIATEPLLDTPTSQISTLVTVEVQNTSNWAQVTASGLMNDKRGELASLVFDKFFPFWIPTGTKEARRMRARRGFF